jgi:hypothetical protein
MGTDADDLARDADQRGRLLGAGGLRPADEEPDLLDALRRVLELQRVEVRHYHGVSLRPGRRTYSGA